MPDGRPLQPGDPARLGSYEIVARLGEGGQGVVYLGRSASGDLVAVKLLRADLAQDETARGRFLRELAAVKRVARFCTAQVLEADAEGDRPYIVSEYVPGPSLHQLVTSESPRSGADLERLAIGTVTALVAIHQAGIVHRDFKPQNVLIGPDGPRVIDFGIAKALDAAATMTNSAIGTPAYMAPEQLSGQEITPAADIFAWASTMVYAATGQSPFGQDTVMAVIHRIINEPPDLGSMEEPLRGVVADCLHKDPARRPQTQLLLMRLLGEEGVTPAAAPAGAAPTAIMGQGAAFAGTMAAGTVPTGGMGAHTMPAGQTGPGQMGPGQMGPGQMGPGQMGPGQMGPGQMGAGWMGVDAPPTMPRPAGATTLPRQPARTRPARMLLVALVGLLVAAGVAGAIAWAVAGGGGGDRPGPATVSTPAPSSEPSTSNQAPPPVVPTTPRQNTAVPPPPSHRRTPTYTESPSPTWPTSPPDNGSTPSPGNGSPQVGNGGPTEPAGASQPAAAPS